MISTKYWVCSQTSFLPENESLGSIFSHKGDNQYEKNYSDNFNSSAIYGLYFQWCNCKS